MAVESRIRAPIVATAVLAIRIKSSTWIEPLFVFRKVFMKFRTVKAGNKLGQNWIIFYKKSLNLTIKVMFFSDFMDN